jgi:polysaccharide pyruvyl transferase WcaK-like protein
MNILYVGDNRDRPNWGCRGTSIALSQLISSKFNISGRISGASIKYPIRVGGIFPKKLSDFLLRRHKKKSIFNYLVQLEEKLGTQLDFITDSPQKSLKNFLKYRHKYTQLKSIYEKVEACEALVINGEGDMILTNPPRRKLLFLLMLMELAYYLDKPVFYINAMVSDCPVTGRNQQTASLLIPILEKCQLVALRDPVSLAIVNDWQAKINVKFVPDALFSWQHYFLEGYLPKNGDFIISHPEADEYFGKFDFSEPFVCIAGTSLVAGNYETAISAYLALVEQMKALNKKLYLVEACSGDRFVKKVSEQSGVPFIPVNIPILMAGSILANASLFISGRYHPSIFASLGGTPCIFLGSNSHKTKSLQQVLEYDKIQEFSAFPTAQECEDILYLAQDKLSQGSELRESIRQVVKQRAEESKKVIDYIS